MAEERLEFQITADDQATPKMEVIAENKALLEKPIAIPITANTGTIEEQLVALSEEEANLGKPIQLPVDLAGGEQAAATLSQIAAAAEEAAAAAQATQEAFTQLGAETERVAEGLTADAEATQQSATAAQAAAGDFRALGATMADFTATLDEARAAAQEAFVGLGASAEAPVVAMQEATVAAQEAAAAVGLAAEAGFTGQEAFLALGASVEQLAAELSFVRSEAQATQAAFTELGATAGQGIGPVAEKLPEAEQGLASVGSGASLTVQELRLLGTVAAGTGISLGGFNGRVVAAAGALALIQPELALVAAGIATAAIAFNSFSDDGTFQKNVDALTKSLREGATAVSPYVDTIEKAVTSNDDFAKSLEEFGVTAGDVYKAVVQGQIAPALQSAIDLNDKFHISLQNVDQVLNSDLAPAFRAYADAHGESLDAALSELKANRELVSQYSQIADEVKKANEAYQLQTQVLRDLVNAGDAQTQNTIDQALANQQNKDTFDLLVKARQDGLSIIKQTNETQGQYVDRLTAEVAAVDAAKKAVSDLNTQRAEEARLIDQTTRQATPYAVTLAETAKVAADLRDEEKALNAAYADGIDIKGKTVDQLKAETRAIDAAKKANDDLVTSHENLNRVVNESTDTATTYSTQVAEAADANSKAADAQNILNAAVADGLDVTSQTIPALADEVAAIGNVQSALKSQADALDSLPEKWVALTAAMSDPEKEAKVFAQSFTDAGRQLFGLADTSDNVTSAMADLIKREKDHGATLDANTVEGNKQLILAEKLRDAVGKDLAEAYRESGGSIDAVVARAQKWSQLFGQQLPTDLDATAKGIQGVGQVIGDIPDLAKKTVDVVVQQQAIDRLNQMKDVIDKLTPGIKQTIQFDIQANPQAANDILDTLARIEKDKLELPVTIRNQIDAAEARGDLQEVQRILASVGFTLKLPTELQDPNWPVESADFQKQLDGLPPLKQMVDFALQAPDPQLALAELERVLPPDRFLQVALGFNLPTRAEIVKRLVEQNLSVPVELIASLTSAEKERVVTELTAAGFSIPASITATLTDQEKADIVTMLHGFGVDDAHIPTDLLHPAPIDPSTVQPTVGNQPVGVPSVITDPPPIIVPVDSTPVVHIPTVFDPPDTTKTGLVELPPGVDLSVPIPLNPVVSQIDKDAVLGELNALAKGPDGTGIPVPYNPAVNQIEKDAANSEINGVAKPNGEDRTASVVVSADTKKAADEIAALIAGPGGKGYDVTVHVHTDVPGKGTGTTGGGIITDIPTLPAPTAPTVHVTQHITAGFGTNTRDLQKAIARANHRLNRLAGVRS